MRKLAMRIALAAPLATVIVAPARAQTPPTPPPEVAVLAKQLAGTTGTTRCTGKVFLPNNVLDMAGTLKTRTDYDGFWIHDTFDARAGKTPFKYDAYTTYDPTAKKWRRVLVDNFGGYMHGWSDGPQPTADGVVLDFVLEGFGPMGPLQFRDHTELTKAGVKASGARSADKGKTWVKDYESTCVR
ncbi:MAG: hypothetical protein NT062_29835 [Proteobacteria bacterium]|nr:hypothetical protein [Pseudomonadota bacterium]